MKRRHQLTDTPDPDEQKAAAELRALLGQRAPGTDPLPPDAYWSNLIIRTNRGIDEASSGRAISISWAARVAIPGVVAILFFFIGLHYYVPRESDNQHTLTSVVLSLPEATIDSLLLEPEHLSVNLSSGDLHEELFDLSDAQISDYFIATGNTQTLLEAMEPQQASDLLATLGSHRN
jgi:hypothetical protein